jgi:hypothetical protein
MVEGIGKLCWKGEVSEARRLANDLAIRKAVEPTILDFEKVRMRGAENK